MGRKSNTRKRYTAEFKKDAVELVRSSGRTVAEVARELGAAPGSAGLGEAGHDRSG
ncbi:transposase [Streptomyces sp. NPDC059605]|uniref:transposase n=1 Tax=unclassified Streptomyces TaxID=2593676 RepID=UPI0036889112